MCLLCIVYVYMYVYMYIYACVYDCFCEDLALSNEKCP